MSPVEEPPDAVDSDHGPARVRISLRTRRCPAA